MKQAKLERFMVPGAQKKRMAPSESPDQILKIARNGKSD